MTKAILNFLYKSKEKTANKEVNKILYFLPASKVGDTIIETFFVKELKKLFPSAEITVLILDPYKVLLSANPNIDKIITMPVNKYKKLLFLIFRAFWIRRKKYDLLIDIPHSGYGFLRYLFLYVCGAKQVMTSNISGYDFITYPLSWSEDVKQHISQEVFVKALRMLGAKGSLTVNYDLYIPKESENCATNFLNYNNINANDFMLFNPEGSLPPRTLKPQKVKEILEKLNKKSEKKIVLLSHKQKYTNLPENVVLFSSNSIMDIAAIISKAGFVLSVDTGIVHIADAFNKPLTILFSEANTDNRPRPMVEFFWSSKNANNKHLKSFYSVNDISTQNIIDSL
ncbi:MAG: hypothetical protein FWD54_00635 [Endomicrobia bacterium]|nr:hypothetical protein [Endomicrobiia bacterium]